MYVNICKYQILNTSSTRTRRGGSCLKDIYETFLIYRTCMRRAPAKPVRACTLRKLCPASHVTLEAPRHTSHLTVFTLQCAAMQHSCSHSNAIMQPEIQEPHRTTHTGTTTRCKTHRRNNSRMNRPQPHPPHRRGTFLRRLQPLYTEKHKVSCPGFLPKT